MEIAQCVFTFKIEIDPIFRQYFKLLRHRAYMLCLLLVIGDHDQNRLKQGSHCNNLLVRKTRVGR
jgi:hypothetical protein